MQLKNKCSLCYTVLYSTLMNSQIQMANLFFIYPPFVFSLLATVTVTTGTATDVYCLKSIKVCLEDPYNHFPSWDFTNQTEGLISHLF